ncbi:hypothetical protein NFHSH190041_19270 [Shewanella sp. NFH-SH190041]|nr:hypothetical protein NFHSH190041_19270 [Shewanella sp. NFH-SH190041]
MGKISKSDLNDRLVATSRAGVEEFGYISKNYENLGGKGQFKSGKIIPGVTRINDAEFIISDKDSYFNHVIELYDDSNNKLNKLTHRLIDEHIINQGGKPLSTMNGLPGLHAEVQAMNDVFNHLEQKHGVNLEFYGLHKIDVSTYKLKGEDGGEFVACYNKTSNKCNYRTKRFYMRVKSEKINFIKDKAYLDNKLFNGISYSVSNGIIKKISQYKNGIEYESYNGIINIIPNSKLVEMAYLKIENDLEPIYYNGDRFSGIAFDFDNDYCVGETLIKDGLIKEEVSFFDNGKINSYDRADECLNQFNSWYFDGEVNEIKIVTPDSLYFSLKLNEHKKLNYLNISDSFFDKVKSISNFLKFNYVNDITFFANIKVAEYLSLSGKGINDMLFDYLSKSEGLKKLKKINIRGTSISDSIINAFDRAENLSEIIIFHNDESMRYTLQNFKINHKNCTIYFNEEKIVYSRIQPRSAPLASLSCFS